MLTANETHIDEKPAHRDGGYFMQFSYTLKTLSSFLGAVDNHTLITLRKDHYQRLIRFNLVEGKMLVL